MPGYGNLTTSAASVVPAPRYPHPDMAAQVRTEVAQESEMRDSGAGLWVLGRVLGRASGARSWLLLLLSVIGSIPS